MEFKTKELEYFVKEICGFMRITEDEMKPLMEFASTIDLSNRDNIVNGYTQEIPFRYNNEKGKVHLLWDVDKTIEFTRKYPERIHCLGEQEFNNRFVLEEPDDSIKEKVVKSIEEKKIYEHSIPYVIVGSVPYFDECHIIDGNYRYYEMLLSGNDIMYFRINADESLLFLSEESRKFVKLCEMIEKSI